MFEEVGFRFALTLNDNAVALKGSFLLTNRFHFAVRLYSANAQMTSKRGESKEVRYEPQASIVTDLLTTF